MKLLLYILLILPSFAFSKGIEVDTFLVRKEDELLVLLETLRKSRSNSELALNNINFTEELKEVLKYPGVMDYPFEKLTTMSTIKSPDAEFRLFNWNIEDEHQQHQHFCFLVRKKGNRTYVTEFKEDKITLPPRPDGMLTAKRWYGALYYKIVPVRSGNKTLYTILGYNGSSRSSNKKILDVFWFKGKTLRIGYPLFQDERDPSVLLRRVFFEYSDKTTISVKHLKDINKIVFDHLTPETPNLKGMYEYYVPDMSYDAYYWEDGFWKYQADISVGNDKEKYRRVYYFDDKTGEEKYKLVAVDWVNPVGGGMGEKHTVAELENNQDTSKKGLRKKKKELKKKRKSEKKNARITRRANKRNMKGNNPHSSVKLKN